MREIGGLPLHPLVVHLPVVLIPLAAVAVVMMALRPSLLSRFGVPTLVLSGLGVVGAFIASSSGEELEDSFRAAGETISGALHDHSEMGESVPWFALLFFVLLLAWVLFVRRGAGAARGRVVRAVLAVLVVVSGLGASASVYLTGHSGATSVWEQDNG